MRAQLHRNAQAPVIDPWPHPLIGLECLVLRFSGERAVYQTTSGYHLCTGCRREVDQENGMPCGCDPN